MIKISLKFIPKCLIGNKLALDHIIKPNRRQAITWTNADPIHWRIYEALGGDELNGLREFVLSIYHNSSWLLCWQCYDRMMSWQCHAMGLLSASLGLLRADSIGDHWIPLTQNQYTWPFGVSFSLIWTKSVTKSRDAGDMRPLDAHVTSL